MTATLNDAFPVLDGTRVQLRAYREQDLASYFALYADARVTRYWSFPAWSELEAARERFPDMLAARDARNALAWAIVPHGLDAPIGNVSLFRIDAVQGRADIGYSLHPDHWGRGYASEALARVLKHAFDAMGLRRIEADIDPRNAASCRLVERLGFVREGLLRERWQVAGEVCDTALYGLLAHDWTARGEARDAALLGAP